MKLTDCMFSYFFPLATIDINNIRRSYDEHTWNIHNKDIQHGVYFLLMTNY